MGPIRSTGARPDPRLGGRPALVGGKAPSLGQGPTLVGGKARPSLGARPDPRWGQGPTLVGARPDPRFRPALHFLAVMDQMDQRFRRGCTHLCDRFSVATEPQNSPFLMICHFVAGVAPGAPGAPGAPAGSETACTPQKGPRQERWPQTHGLTEPGAHGAGGSGSRGGLFGGLRLHGRFGLHRGLGVWLGVRVLGDVLTVIGRGVVV